MDLNGLKTLVHRGEDSQHQFKETIHNPDALAAEMVAFSNSEGGTILIGIADDHSLVGVAREALGKINQLISNTASQHVRSPNAVMTDWPDIEFIDDREGVCFKVIIRRHASQRNVTLSNQVDESIPEYTSSPPLSLTLPFSALRQRILQLITHHPQATYEEMALNFGKDRTTIMRNIAKLKKGGILRRIGSKKTG